MTIKNLVLKWSDGRTMPIKMHDNPVAEFYSDCVRHLRHIDLFFSPRENPYHPDFSDAQKVIDRLIAGFSNLGYDINVLMLSDQKYLNHLHQIYFDNCREGDTQTYLTWTHVHDDIHTLECINGNRKEKPRLILNYRNLAGLLYKKFDREYMKYATTEKPKGTCFLREQELGKDPITYFQNNESSDINLMYQVSKPWVNLIPTMNIALDDQGTEPFPDGFIEWFQPLKDAWRQHWNQPDWEPWEIGAAIPVGVIEDIDELIGMIKKEDYPIRIGYENS